jgi:hypothetical protein
MVYRTRLATIASPMRPNAPATMEFAWDALTQAVMHGGCTSSLMDHHWVNLVTNVAAEAEASLGNGAVASPDTAPVSDGSLGGSAEFNEESTSPQATSQTPSVSRRRVSCLYIGF